MKNFIQKYALAMVAVATIITFSAFKATGVDIKQPRMTVAIFFHGDPLVQSQVEDESLWNTTPNGETCDETNDNACMQLVEDSDLIGGTTLDPVKITLGAINPNANYIPTRTGGSSLTPFRPINRS